ncbi:hypothetical protein Tco_1525475, partial [Tanacetum coccineum]
KKKKKQKNAGESSLKKDKAPIESSNYETYVDVDEPQEQEVPTDVIGGKYSFWIIQQKKKDEIDDDNTPEYSWFNDFVDATKDLEENEIQEGSTIMCAKKLKEILKKEKITKADLRGAGFKLLKSRFSNSIELEYNMEQIYLAMKTIPTSYFFYIDLEYLMDWNKEKKHALSLSKYYAAKYEQEGIKEIILNLWTYGIEKYDIGEALGIHHWNESRKWFYKGSIGVKSDHEISDGKDYEFKESDYPRLSLNNIEDMYLLKRKLNLEKPRFFANDIQYKLPYTTNGIPKGVVYHNKNGQKMLT